MKEPTNEVDKNAVAVVRTNYHCKEGVVGMCNRISMTVSLPHCALDIFATRKRVNHGGEYGLEIPENFHFLVI